MIAWSSLAAAALVIWLVIALLPWRPWSTAEHIEALPSGHIVCDLSSVSVLIPARDEADSIGRTLRGVAAQGQVAKIIVVDDQSDDGTAAVACAENLATLEIVYGSAPEPGWSGKLWALHQGLGLVESSYTLLLDADIELAPGILSALVRKLEDEERTMVSVMAKLSMVSAWESLLIPPFIYFFKLLYPFALTNASTRWVAAAAGGCVLIRTEALHAIGGFAALRGALIDDCTLARRIKDAGGRLWLGLSTAVRAIRPYPDLSSIWNMVARTAFTQLRYSSLLLILCSGLMLLLFAVPVLGLCVQDAYVRGAALAALCLMFTTYWPTVKYYRRRWWWMVSLPIAAFLYLAMTWTSAVRFWFGERSRWKNRVYDRRTSAVTGSNH
ncbi:MAG: glycosyltransferase [Gammaproteobacteria bacterium]|nr:glycosyltransferase [Gammaproteobacteria bacterium]